MLKVKVNNTKEHQIKFLDAKKLSGTINEIPFEWDIIKVKEGSFHIIKDRKSYSLEVINTDFEKKIFTVKINRNKYELQVKDRFDDLLKSLGMENINNGKINEIKAPMPGLVIDIMVASGSEVKKGDPIMVLEAMKMENILKSPSDGRIKKIHVEKRQAVEKNQVLVNLE